jgi:hypothetical protein
MKFAKSNARGQMYIKVSGAFKPWRIMKPGRNGTHPERLEELFPPKHRYKSEYTVSQTQPRFMYTL